MRSTLLDRNSRFGRAMWHAGRLGKHLWRFLSDAKFRSKTVHFIQNQTSTDGSTPTREKALRPAPAWLAGFRLYLVGGCELTYLKEFFEERGAVVYHTFDHHRSSDPHTEVSDGDSPLFGFKPDVVLLSPVQGSARLFDILQTRGLTLSAEDQQRGLDSAIAGLAAAVTVLRERMAAPVILLSQLLVHRPAFGVLEQSVLGDTLSLAEMKRHYDLGVYGVARGNEATYVLDVDVALSGQGFDTTLRGASELLGVHFTRAGGRLVAERCERMLWALDGRSRRIKCAVFDLDDTLWSGVLREDGVDGVFVRHNHLGAMRLLAGRGVLLAVCSKNDPVEAELVARLLGAELNELIVSMSLSWEPKSGRLRELADQLGIGIDALAFFDDNPRERAEVTMNAGEVLVLSDAEILDALSMPEFEPGPTLTSEASQRTSLYKSRAERTRVEAASSDPDAFSRSLGLRVDVHRAGPGEMPRVAELIARTNQMNATLRRSTLADLQVAARLDHGAGVRVAYLNDQFGDYGLIGAVVTETDGEHLRVTELALSCRAMGRYVEHVMIAEVARAAQASSMSSVRMNFRSTDRNGQLRKILRDIGFVEHSNQSDVVSLALEVGAHVPVPDWITISDSTGR